jgi:hypothetical protein
MRQVWDVASAFTFDDDDLAALGGICLCEVHLLTRRGGRRFAIFKAGANLKVTKKGYVWSAR